MKMKMVVVLFGDKVDNWGPHTVRYGQTMVFYNDKNTYHDNNDFGDEYCD